VTGDASLTPSHSLCGSRPPPIQQCGRKLNSGLCSPFPPLTTIGLCCRTPAGRDCAEEPVFESPPGVFANSQHVQFRDRFFPFASRPRPTASTQFSGFPHQFPLLISQNRIRRSKLLSFSPPPSKLMSLVSFSVYPTLQGRLI